MYRLLRALASVGIFAEGEPRQFSLTPLAEPLQSDVPGSKRALALMSGDEQFRAWAEIDYSIRTGKKAFDKVFGKPIFDYLGEHPDKARIFDAAMVGIHGRESSAILDAYDFSGIGVAGRHRRRQRLAAHRHPQQTPEHEGHPLRSAACDRASQGRRSKPRALPIVASSSPAASSKRVPDGADAYLMRHIIHDWDDEKSLTILRNCHRAMSADGKLLVVESVIPPGNEPFGGKFLDLVMLLIPGGKERTEDEYRTLFDQAGFDAHANRADRHRSQHRRGRQTVIGNGRIPTHHYSKQ